LALSQTTEEERGMRLYLITPIIAALSTLSVIVLGFVEFGVKGGLLVISAVMFTFIYVLSEAHAISKVKKELNDTRTPR
jgi:hypothetical protein